MVEMTMEEIEEISLLNHPLILAIKSNNVTFIHSYHENNFRIIFEHKITPLHVAAFLQNTEPACQELFVYYANLHTAAGLCAADIAKLSHNEFDFSSELEPNMLFLSLRRQRSGETSFNERLVARDAGKYVKNKENMSISEYFLNNNRLDLVQELQFTRDALIDLPESEKIQVFVLAKKAKENEIKETILSLLSGTIEAENSELYKMYLTAAQSLLKELLSSEQFNQSFKVNSFSLVMIVEFELGHGTLLSQAEIFKYLLFAIINKLEYVKFTFFGVEFGYLEKCAATEYQTCDELDSFFSKFVLFTLGYQVSWLTSAEHITQHLLKVLAKSTLEYIERLVVQACVQSDIETIIYGRQLTEKPFFELGRCLIAFGRRLPAEAQPSSVRLADVGALGCLAELARTDCVCIVRQGEIATYEAAQEERTAPLQIRDAYAKELKQRLLNVEFDAEKLPLEYFQAAYINGQQYSLAYTVDLQKSVFCRIFSTYMLTKRRLVRHGRICVEFVDNSGSSLPVGQVGIPFAESDFYRVCLMFEHIDDQKVTFEKGQIFFAGSTKESDYPAYSNSSSSINVATIKEQFLHYAQREDFKIDENDFDNLLEMTNSKSQFTNEPRITQFEMEEAERRLEEVKQMIVQESRQIEHLKSLIQEGQIICAIKNANKRVRIREYNTERYKNALELIKVNRIKREKLIKEIRELEMRHFEKNNK